MSEVNTSTAATPIKSVVIEPNYSQIFNSFSKDFQIHAQSVNDLPLDAHRDVHQVMVSLNIAFQSVSCTADFERLRELVADAVSESHAALLKKEGDGDEDATDSEREVYDDYSDEFPDDDFYRS